MNILITGAAGFLGTECNNLLFQHGHEVITTDRHGTVDIHGDLANKHFTDALPDVDVVVNCAAVQYVTANLPLIKRKEYFFRNNVVTCRYLAERYNNQASATHFIHIGTSMMYRQTGQKIYDTTSTMGGEGVYSKSKMAGQRFIDAIPGAATIIPCIIGGIGREGLFRGFVSLMQRFALVMYPGSGTHKIHMVHVKDVARLVLCIINEKLSGYYNAAAPDPLSIREWITEMEDELNLKPVRQFSLPLKPISFLAAMTGYRLLAREQLLMLGMPHVLNIEGSLKIGWTPQYSNARIARDIAAYISNTARKS